MCTAPAARLSPYFLDRSFWLWGNLSSRYAVTPACTLMIAMAWATVSWTSRAIRSRSASTRERASSSPVRSACRARSSASAAMTRRDRTDSPRAAAMIDAAIRKNTQPMAAHHPDAARAGGHPPARPP
jgi:hypothetical protein